MTNQLPNAKWLAALAVALAVAWASAVARGEDSPAKPQQLSGVGITPHFDAQIPLDLAFTDSSGKAITLADVFDGSKPVILTLNYSNCPKLCSLQLNGLVAGLKKMPWTLGEEYRVLTISIDPLESAQRSQMTKEKYLRDYGRAVSPEAWRFVVSPKEANIHKVADTVGFGYVYDPAMRQYNHVAELMICTPNGRVARYVGGIEYDPQTLRFALLEAGRGKVGSTFDHFVLYCFSYDDTTGRYTFAAVKLMQVGAVLTLVVLGLLLLVYWRREVRRRHAAPQPAAQPHGAS